MKNRLLWILILAIFIFVWFFYLISREIKPKNEKNTNSWIVKNVEEKVNLKKISEKTNSWQIEKNNEKENNFAYFGFGEDKFRFNINNSKLEIKLNENSLGFFEVILSKEINVQKIYGEEWLFLISLWKERKIYSKKTWFVKEFSSKLFIDYAKISETNFIFYSNWKWAFVLEKNKNELEYFSLFSDFIYFKNGYISFILAENSELKNRFKISSNNNFLIYFDPETKEVKKILELNFLPKKIWQENSKIFLENEKNEKFELEKLSF